MFEPCKQQGLFAPRTLLRFSATVDPSDSISSSTDFPVFPVIRLPASAHFWNGTRRVSPVAWCTLAFVLSLRPRQSGPARRSVCAVPCGLHPPVESSAFSRASPFRGQVCVVGSGNGAVGRRSSLAGALRFL